MMLQISQPHTQQLRQAIDVWVDLPTADWATFLSIFRPRTAAPRQHIMHPGDETHELLFCCQGVLR